MSLFFDDYPAFLGHKNVPHFFTKAFDIYFSRPQHCIVDEEGSQISRYLSKAYFGCVYVSGRVAFRLEKSGHLMCRALTYMLCTGC